jgi:hypothetical protein
MLFDYQVNVHYAQSLHPKIVLPKTPAVSGLRLGNMQPKLLNLFLPDL